MADYVSVALSRRPVGHSEWEGTSPNARRVSPVVRVTEEWGHWMIGHLTRHPEVAVELSFENYQQFQERGLSFGPTPFCYIGMWSAKDTLYEFQMGSSTTYPPDFILHELHSLMQLTEGYRPFALPPRLRVPEGPPHELPLQSVPKRQDRRDRQSRLRKGRNKTAARLSCMRVPIYHP